MSMIGNYRRVPQANLDELLAHPERLSSFLYPDKDPDDTPHRDIDKTWHIIHFLLNGETWEGTWPLVAVVMGGTQVSDEDVGYGPARYLTPSEVDELSGALAGIPAHSLWSRFDVEAVRRAEIFPEHWSGSPEDRNYVTDHYTRLQDFFATAAKSQEVMIVYLS